MPSMTATVTYRLSASGQRDALARGLPGTRDQSVVLPVENGDLQYYAVASDGSLSLDLYRYAGHTRRSYGSWDDHVFDTHPSATDLLAYLRGRKQLRAEVEAAERTEMATRVEKEQAEIATRVELENAATAAYTALTLEQQVEALCGAGAQVQVDGALLTLSAAAVPAVAAAVAERDRRAELRKSIPAGPLSGRDVSVTATGSYTWTVPTAKFPDAWAKLITAIDPSKSGGFAIEGAWNRPR